MINNETVFIISGILGIWTWLFKVFVIESLQKSIDNLAETIAHNVTKTHELDTAVKNHGILIGEMNHRIEKLENENHNQIY